ncbi:NAD-dependent epimerase/dehydratase family protein [Butyrivibrio sp. YAB3001]|uniref:NAD-dependent epimerase/dehydratase family protein n=1 Tax=Butyrivibrio sp. YAB3001 TaxID=1520812 RepID=UPI0015881070|nr:NAD-dependent epimerase/dehydratase family protein [Butyrivibrio sp. YAB3001]
MVEKRDVDIILNNPIDWEKFKNKTILVTGATGRLGMFFVESILKADIDYNLNLRVIALARSKEKLNKCFNETLNLPNVSLLVQDITTPIHVEDGVDFIIHTAGAASPKDFTENPVETLWGHVQGTRNVLELAREKKTQKVLYVSTVEIYGQLNQEAKIKEEDMGALKCDEARSCYPEAKRLCEAMLASYEAEYGIDYVCTRLCHTLGPGIVLDDGRAFAEFLRCVIDGKDIVLHTAGNAMRTYTYVGDAVGAMLLTLTSGKQHHYNVANINNLISIKDLAELIAAMNSKGTTKVVIKIKDEDYKYLPFKLGIMNVDKIMKLGWYPQVGIKDTFKYTLDSFLQQV